jgi:hypothetical protein
VVAWLLLAASEVSDDADDSEYDDAHDNDEYKILLNP